jgi:ASC-1-like (ASCH) protein
MIIHELKTWTEYFVPIDMGIKTFEIRFNDRKFKVGDILHLREWDRVKMEYTMEHLFARVTYILDDFAGLQSGYVAMQIKVLREHQVELMLEEAGVSIHA